MLADRRTAGRLPTSALQYAAKRVCEEAGEAFARAAGWRDLELRMAEFGYRLARRRRSP